MSSPRSRIHAALALAFLAALAAGWAAWKTPWAERVFKGRALEKLRLTGARPCRFGAVPSDCPPEQECVSGQSTDKFECMPRHAGSTPFLRFPFEPDHPVICLQGPATHSKIHSHSGFSTLHAVDLATPPGQSPGIIHAAMEGTAIVHRGCPASQEPSCGSAWGNHVRILNPDTRMVVFYANLEQIWIQDGQTVRLGEPIGKEGSSGRPGDRRLHFSVHQAPPEKHWLEVLDFYRSHPGALPQSIPFETQYCDPAVSDACQRVRSRVEGLPCSAKNAELRADWRN